MGDHLSEIQNKSLREQVTNALRDAILDGEFKPGHALIETDLASRMGISRAPLREALRVLSVEGLVETVAYRGTTVRELTKTDIEEIYSLRARLEAFAIHRIFQQAEHALVVAELRSIYEAMLRAAELNDLKRVNQEDRRFHTTLIELSHHSLLLSIWNMVSMRVRQVMALLNQRNRDLKQIAYNHLPIIEALEAGNEALALDVIQQHVANTGNLIFENWSEGE
jgi:DNA-binding GntR family transcriptional regulator